MQPELCQRTPVSCPHRVSVQRAIPAFYGEVHLLDIMPPYGEAFTRCTSHPKNRLRPVFSLEISKLLVLLSAASRFKSRQAVRSLTHHLTLPYSLELPPLL